MRVLWVSRHDILPAQRRLLFEKLGACAIETLQDRVPNVEWLLKNVILPEKIDVVIPVLPLSMIARLVELGKKHNFEVWWSQMELLHNDYGKCPEYDAERDAMVPSVDANGKKMWRHYRFRGFYRIKKVKLELEEIAPKRSSEEEK